MRDYFTEDFDAEAYLDQLQLGMKEGRLGPNWIIKKGGLAVFLPLEIWHFARPMGHIHFNLDYGVEMHRLGSGRGYFDYLFVILANPENYYVKYGPLRGPVTRVAHLSLEQYYQNHTMRERVRNDETDSFRRLWSEELASCWSNPSLELQKMYCNHWRAEYQRMKEDAKRGGWKLDYDMPL